MSTPNDSPEISQADSPTVSKSGRRRFLGAGTAVAPVILTMFSQPALGVTCFTPSRSLSRNTSVSQAGKNGDCTGRKPAWYRNNPTAWPVPTTTPFHPTFSGAKMMAGTPPASRTLLEVLNLPAGAQHRAIAIHFVTAFLNIRAGRVSVLALDENKLRAMWTEWDNTGFFRPTAGVQWNAAAIIAYFDSNGITA